MNRQLVWHAFTDFLLFVLPLVGINRWRRWLSRTWTRLFSIVRRLRRLYPRDTTDSDKSPVDTLMTTTGKLAFLPERTCAICHQQQITDLGLVDHSAAPDRGAALGGSGAGGVVGSALTDITNPYETIPCGCIYCFVCLAQALDAEEGDGWACLRCGNLVHRCQPWTGDVVLPHPLTT